MRTRVHIWALAGGRSTGALDLTVVTPRLLAVVVSVGLGMLATVVAAVALAVVVGPIARSVGLPGPFSTWGALFVGGYTAAYFLPSFWYAVSPLCGLTLAITESAWMAAHPIQLAQFPRPLESDFVQPGLWFTSTALSWLGGYCCRLVLRRREV